MAALSPPICDFGRPAPDFALPGTDGRRYALADVAGPNGTLIAFVCNHCPFVLAILDKLIRDARDLKALGVGVAAICANDAVAYPEDGFEAMAAMARDRALPFPYLHDEDQSVARAYGAVCTPDFFGYGRASGLQYRGRLDATRMTPERADHPRELFDAMALIARTGRGPEDQTPSIGCSIKWR
ncbi:MAG: thioredoxin family protein [Shimia sp.]